MKTFKLWIVLVVPVVLLVASMVFYTIRRPASTTEPVYSLGEPIGKGIQRIAEGRAAMLTASIEPEHCADLVTISAAGVLPGDILLSNFATDPSDLPGYGADSNGQLVITSYVSSNTVNFKVCNVTAHAITPGPVELKWQAMRP